MKNTVYLESANLVRHNESLLFQRFNYFLVGNSFLIIGFIALAFFSYQSSEELYYENLRGLALLLGWLGLGLSWLMAAINLHDAKILKMFYSHARKIEEELDKKAIASALPYQKHYREIFTGYRFKFNFNSLLFSPAIESLKSFSGKSRVPAAYTWVAPFCSAVFWIISICFFYFQSPNAVGLTLRIVGGFILAYFLANITISIIQVRGKIKGMASSTLVKTKTLANPIVEKVIRVPQVFLSKIRAFGKIIAFRVLFTINFIASEAKALIHLLFVKAKFIACIAAEKSRLTFCIAAGKGKFRTHVLINKIKTSASSTVRKTMGL